MFRIVVIKRVCKSHCWNVGYFNGRRVDYIRLKKKGGLVSYSKGYIYKIVMLMKTRQYACLFVVSNAYYKISLTELKWFNTDWCPLLARIEYVLCAFQNVLYRNLYNAFRSNYNYNYTHWKNTHVDSIDKNEFIYRKCIFHLSYFFDY